MSYNKLKSLVANIEAIKTAFQLRREKRKATQEEREILAKYSGFGGISEILNIGTEIPVADNLKQPLQELTDVLKQNADGNEELYNALVKSLKSSVLTAFYTPKHIIDIVASQIQQTLTGHGLQMKTFLEPSAGVGGFLPVAMQDTRKTAFEKDLITGLVLSALADDTHVVIDGFETIDSQTLENDSFDVIASNIPFGNFKVLDMDFERMGMPYSQATKTIHNYFFVKAVEKLKDGGLLAFITSRGVANAPGNRFVRDYLVHHCNMITALRLPDTLFMQTGGVEVGSDLFIFQKNSHKSDLTTRERMFLDVAKEMNLHGNVMTEPSNKVFTLPKTTLATDSSIQMNQYGKYVRQYFWKDDEAKMKAQLSSLLQSDFDRYFRKNLYSGTRTAPIMGDLFSMFDLFDTAQEQPKVKPNRGKREYTGDIMYWMKDGVMILFEEQLGILQYKRANLLSEQTVTFVPLKMQNFNKERAQDYFAIRESYFALTAFESEHYTEHPQHREQLNSNYDRFVQKWGFFHNNDNKEFIMLDSLGMEIYTIEIQIGDKIMKADIMNEPVAFKKIDSTVILSPTEALASSLNYYGRVRMDYLTQTTGKSETQVIEALDGEMFYNPQTESWEEKGRFLAGDVVSKCKELQIILDGLTDTSKGWTEKSVCALEKAIPEQIPYEELDFNLGERWIPVTIYEDFAKYLFQTNVKVMYFDVNDTYIVSLDGYSPVAYQVYSVRGYNGEDLFVHALHDTVPEITKEIYKDGDKVRVPDEEAIQEAGTKIQEIRTKFNEWLDGQPIAMRDELVRLYNERFNCYVRPTYDGSAQTFPNLSFEQFPYKELYPSQKDAIWMLKQNGGGVCWHEVGAGKTMIMCVAAYEMKRLGLVQKPLIIGLKANVHEIADCFRKAYPTAKLLYPGKEDFTPANRLELFSKIKNNNWDCIILTHDQFAKIPQSDETRRGIMEQELMDVERCLRALEESTMRWRSGKMQQGLEKRQENLTVELNRLEASIEKHKDDSIDFHSMGIDHIFVDECHMFKNLMFQTRHTRVAGIGNTKGSQRALNLLVAIRDIQKRTGKDLGATFLSGTVVVNALTELYVLFKYLRPKELAKQKVSCFDAWAAIFTKKSTDYELSVTGSIKRKERFRTYIKVPELSAFLREITDYRTAEMMQLDVPDKNVQFLSNKPTIEQEDMIMHLVAFANSGEWDDLGLDTLPPDNLEKAKMLIATDIARKMALDMRLLGEKFSDDRENKASRCAQVIYEKYIRTAENKGTQFVFSDLSTYKPHEWNIYQDIKDKLVALGIPANEIQFVHTFKTERARKRMIEEMNEGTIRVLFGSTSMLGTGVNAQQRAVAVHHLDIPWRPADLEQRNGRAVRKGNGVKLWGNNKVDVFIYGTEKTLDAYKFNLLKNKQMFINQINNGTISVRRIDEDSMDENNGMNFAEFVAILSGNTDLLDKAKLDNKIMLLTKEQTLFNKERYRAERKIEQNRQDIIQYDANIKRMCEDLDYYNDHKNESHVLLNGLQEATMEETGRELHRISKRYRGDDYKVIGSYMGLNLLVKSEWNFSGIFDRNIFFVEGVSGLKYRCGASGALPLGFKAAAEYPQAALEGIGKLIDRQKENLFRLESEIPTLQQIIERKWNKTEELETLKFECEALQKRIDEALKQAENKTVTEVAA